jgi:hydroxymethylbilane synthase
MRVATEHTIRIGSRGSPLARAQAETVKTLLRAADGLPAEDCEIVIIQTTGDLQRDRPLADIGGKGMFTKEIEEALLAGTIDLAVHSMKDVPTALPEGLSIAAVLPREDPRDAFVSPRAEGIDALPDGAVVGTSSLRRGALLRWRRPDLKVAAFRGNIDTRLDKLARGEVDATLLAQAGLNRLGLDDQPRRVLTPDEMLPAVAQGAVGIECRDDDTATRARVAALDHGDTAIRIRAERALLAALDGSCRTPIAALAMIADGQLWLRGSIIRPDGRVRHDGERRGTPTEAEDLGRDLGADLRARGGPEFFTAP